MPVYDYQCQKCKHTFSDIKKIDERHVPTNESCPQCLEVGHVQICIGKVATVDPLTLGRLKPHPELVEKLRRIKKKTPGSNIRDW